MNITEELQEFNLSLLELIAKTQKSRDLSEEFRKSREMLQFTIDNIKQ